MPQPPSRTTSIIAATAIAALLLGACQTAAPEPTPAAVSPPAAQPDTLRVRVTASLDTLDADGAWSATVELQALSGQPPFTFEAGESRTSNGDPVAFSLSGSNCGTARFVAVAQSSDGQQALIDVGLGPAGCQATAGGPPSEEATPQPAAAPDASGQPSEATDLLDRINALRAEDGLAPYTLNVQLSAAALRHSQDMAGTGNISHTGSDDSSARQRILDTGYPAVASAEGIYGGASLDDAFQFWSTDPDHRPSLLSTQYREIGFGTAQGGFLTYFTITFGAQ